MADQEPKQAIGSELQHEIAAFKKETLQQTETKEKNPLPDAATIEAEKKAVKETSGQ